MTEFSVDLWPPSLLNRKFRPSAKVTHQGPELTEVPKFCWAAPAPASAVALLPLLFLHDRPNSRFSSRVALKLPGHATFYSMQEKEFVSILGTTQKQNARLHTPHQLSFVVVVVVGCGSAPFDLYWPTCYWWWREKVTWSRAEPSALPSGLGLGRSATDVLQGAWLHLCVLATTTASIIVIRMYNSNYNHNINNDNVHISIDELNKSFGLVLFFHVS